MSYAKSIKELSDKELKASLAYHVNENNIETNELVKNMEALIVEQLKSEIKKRGI